MPLDTTKNGKQKFFWHICWCHTPACRAKMARLNRKANLLYLFKSTRRLEVSRHFRHMIYKMFSKTLRLTHHTLAPCGLWEHHSPEMVCTCYAKTWHGCSALYLQDAYNCKQISYLGAAWMENDFQERKQSNAWHISENVHSNFTFQWRGCTLCATDWHEGSTASVRSMQETASKSAIYKQGVWKRFPRTPNELGTNHFHLVHDAVQS